MISRVDNSPHGVSPPTPLAYSWFAGRLLANKLTIILTELGFLAYFRTRQAFAMQAQFD